MVEWNGWDDGSDASSSVGFAIMVKSVNRSAQPAPNPASIESDRPVHEKASPVDRIDRVGWVVQMGALCDGNSIISERSSDGGHACFADSCWPPRRWGRCRIVVCDGWVRPCVHCLTQPRTPSPSTFQTGPPGWWLAPPAPGQVSHLTPRRRRHVQAAAADTCSDGPVWTGRRPRRRGRRQVGLAHGVGAGLVAGVA